jgi:hypothetical protein
MQLCDFEEQIFSMDQAIHLEISKYPLPTQPRSPKDLGKLRGIVRRAARDLILCRDVDHAIRRLLQDPQAWSAIVALTVEAPLSLDDHKLAARRAFEATPREPHGLPFYPFCFYLIELCDVLRLAQSENGETRPVSTSAATAGNDSCLSARTKLSPNLYRL